jgi:lysophospholipase L1-like esterase
MMLGMHVKRRWSLERDLYRYVIAMVVTGVILAGSPGSSIRPAAAGASGSVLPILAMGDSYSAGNGAGMYYGPVGCWRSPNNYADLYARGLESPPYNQPTSYVTVTCSGDTTSSFFSTANGRPPQLNGVNKTFALIFLTIGGNDVNFAGIVKDCLISAFIEPAHCKALLEKADKLLSNGTIEGRISRVLSGIRRRASSHATIVLLGYPYLESDENYQINKGAADAYDVGKWVRAIGDKGDAIEQHLIDLLNRRNHTHSFVFVGTKRLFKGHELSADGSNPQRWFVEPLTDSTIASHATWYHPDPVGWQEEADQLLADPRIPKHSETQPGSTISQRLEGIPQSGKALGSSVAPVTLQFFGDLESPVSKEFVFGALQPVIQRWVRSGHLRIEYLSLETSTRYPEDFQLQQCAALAAGEQNKMWQFIELFYKEQGEVDTGYMNEAYLQRLAKRIPALDFTQWEIARNNPVPLARQLDVDVEAANKAGIKGTPSFLIGRTGAAMHKFAYNSLSDPRDFDQAVTRVLPSR